MITLTKVAPDFLSRTSMPFFSAVPTTRPSIRTGSRRRSSRQGRTHVKEWTQKRTALLVRNPYWRSNAEPWKSLGRPAERQRDPVHVRQLARGDALRLEANEADLGAVPPAALADLAQKYGVNKGRWFIRKQQQFWYFALNNDQPLFKGNTKLRQAVNWAIDRPQLARQYGYLGGARTDQVLMPGLLGYHDWNIYPLGGVTPAVLRKARSLAQGATRSGKVTMYTFNSSPGPQVAQVLQYNLQQIGLDVDIKTYDRVVQNTKGGTNGEPFDITYDGWGADYPDPYQLRQQASGRHEHPGDEQQQHVVLQRPVLQQEI